jgi:predicted nuclease of predicted toxin-antitoxin system
MSVRIFIDMNLSPDWEPVLTRDGWSAIHWSKVGDPRAPGRVIMDWALANCYVMFTHDLDFGTTLALTRAKGPSVVQLRSDDVLPDHLEGIVIAALKQHAADLDSGALVVVDEHKCRVRVLPI